MLLFIQYLTDLCLSKRTLNEIACRETTFNTVHGETSLNDIQVI